MLGLVTPFQVVKGSREDKKGVERYHVETDETNTSTINQSKKHKIIFSQTPAYFHI